MANLTQIQERFDARASEALETLIEEVEQKNPVKVVALDVDLVPVVNGVAGTTTVEVNLTVQPVAAEPIKH